MNASVDGPQPATSQSEHPDDIQPPTRSTTKKTTGTRQTKRKGVKTLKPKPVPLEDTTAAASQSHTGDNETGVDPPPVADPSTRVVKKKAPRPLKQGTRFSARLRDKNPEVVNEPTPTEPETKQTKRKRRLGDGGAHEDATTDLPKKQTKVVADNQTDTPAQAGSTTATEPPKKQIKVVDAPAQAKSTTTTKPPKKQVKAAGTPAQVKDTTPEPPKKQTKVADTPAQTKKTTTPDPPRKQINVADTPAQATTSKNATVNDPEPPENEEAEASAAADDNDDDQPAFVHRCYLRKENGNVSICLGLFPRDSLPPPGQLYM